MTADVTEELQEQFIANIRDDFSAVLNHVRPREPISVVEWSRKYRRIGQGGSPLSMHGDIAFDPSVMPWVIEPMEAAIDPTVSHLVMYWASGTGKTDGVCSNIIGWAISESPRNIMALYPNENARDKWSRDVLQRTIDATPILRSLVTEKKGRESGNSIGYKAFPGGSVYATAAGSASNLRGPRVGLAYAGEVDAMPDSVGREGDPLELLFRRCEGFSDSIKIIEGTGTIKGRSRIESWMLQTDFRKWHVPCRKCDARQVMMFRGIKWPKGKPQLAEYECEQCGAMHSDAQRVRISRDGQWKATAPETGLRGYWTNAFVTTLPPEKGYSSKMHQWAAQWIRACHSENPREKKRVFINTVLAETDEEEPSLDVATEWEPIYNRREPYVTDALADPICPALVRVITCGMDVQQDRVEALVLGWGSDEQCWIIEQAIIYGDPNTPDLWRAVDAFTERKYKHASGAHLSISISFIDSGRWTDDVYKFAGQPKFAGRLYACKGASENGLPIVGRIRKTGRGNVYFRLGTDSAKEYIYGRLTLPFPEDGKSFPPGFVHFPQSIDAEFFRQLVNERAKSVYERGRQFRKYVIDNPNVRVEALDTFVYGLAAFRLRRWDWASLDGSLAESIKSAVKTAPVASHDDDDDGGFIRAW